LTGFLLQKTAELGSSEGGDLSDVERKPHGHKKNAKRAEEGRARNQGGRASELINKSKKGIEGERAKEHAGVLSEAQSTHNNTPKKHRLSDSERGTGKTFFF